MRDACYRSKPTNFLATWPRVDATHNHALIFPYGLLQCVSYLFMQGGEDTAYQNLLPAKARRTKPHRFAANTTRSAN